MLKKAKESLSSIYPKNSPFKKELHSIVDKFMTQAEFESRWNSMVQNHGLVENAFLYPHTTQDT